MVDDKLVWDQHIDYKITCHTGILKCIRHFIPRESLLLLYRTLIILYGGQCVETLKDRLQTLQNKTARTIVKL